MVYVNHNSLLETGAYPKLLLARGFISTTAVPIYSVSQPRGSGLSLKTSHRRRGKTTKQKRIN